MEGGSSLSNSRDRFERRQGRLSKGIHRESSSACTHSRDAKLPVLRNTGALRLPFGSSFPRVASILNMTSIDADEFVVIFAGLFEQIFNLFFMGFGSYFGFHFASILGSLRG